VIGFDVRDSVGVVAAAAGEEGDEAAAGAGPLLLVTYQGSTGVELSACATPEPPTRAAPNPTATAPALSHPVTGRVLRLCLLALMLVLFLSSVLIPAPRGVRALPINDLDLTVL
jgi:hypothetical protein